MSDPIRNVIAERMRRTVPYPDETESAFEEIPLAVNEHRPFGIWNQSKGRVMDIYKTEIRRRNGNEKIRMKQYDGLVKKTEAAFRIQRIEPIRSTSVNQDAEYYEIEPRKVTEPDAREMAAKVNQTYGGVSTPYPTGKKASRNASIGNINGGSNYPQAPQTVNMKRGNIKSSYQDTFAAGSKNPRALKRNMGYSRSMGGNSFNFMKNYSTPQPPRKQISQNYICEDDYPKPKSIQETQFSWPPQEPKAIINHLKLKNRGFLEGCDPEWNPDVDQMSHQTEPCHRLDIPPHYGAYSNKPLGQMLNHNHHKTIRSTHGKWFKSLVPWKDTEIFKDKFYYDPRTQAPPKGMYKNNLMDGLAGNHKNIESVPNLSSKMFDLKDQEFLRDDRLKFQKNPGADRVTHIYNDYHRKVSKDGYSRNNPDGKPWFH